MRCVTYAGRTVMTTDDVAGALVTLTAAVAQTGASEAVRIPILIEGSGGEVGEADLVIGVGNDVLSSPATWEGETPDFSAAAQRLTSHHLYPHRERKTEADPADRGAAQDVGQNDIDFDYDGYIDSL